MNEILKVVIATYIDDADDYIGGMEDFVDEVNKITTEEHGGGNSVVTIERIKPWIDHLLEEIST